MDRGVWEFSTQAAERRGLSVLRSCGGIVPRGSSGSRPWPAAPPRSPTTSPGSARLRRRREKRSRPAPPQLAPATPGPDAPPLRLHFQQAPQGSASPAPREPLPPAAAYAVAHLTTGIATVYGHPPQFAAASVSSADGFEARFTRMQAYFAAEHDEPPMNASPASSAMSTTEVSSEASQARPAAPLDADEQKTC